MDPCEGPSPGLLYNLRVMAEGSSVLLATAATVGLVHTLLGPDHYLPFVVMARAWRWSTARTALITLLCGIGHVGSSVVLGLIGAALGVAVERLVAVESLRGEVASWMLIAFGLVYTVYGLRLAMRGKKHSHVHVHEDGAAHAHEHAHVGEHTHVHTGERPNMTPWVLFTIFVFGPCEPLIPLVMYPAMAHSYGLMMQVAIVFSVITIATMLVVVLLGARGLELLPAGRLERYSHALAGAAVLLSGLAIRFLGL